MSSFEIIQGGMGVAVSGWRLAGTVARLGQLGVVSGTGLTVLLARRLQSGDPDGTARRALASFPIPAVAERALERYFVPDGIADDQSFKLTPMPRVQSGDAFDEMTILANYVEVFLAKEGHDGVIGINYLEKIQFPTLPSLYGAMLAGVDYVLMGAGIPRFIPGILDQFSQGEAAELRIDVEEVPVGEHVTTHFDPQAFCGGKAPVLKRPKFLAIISSAVLATTLARKSSGKVDGFVIEGATAGGHNAPPRGVTQLSHLGEPVYGPRDDVDLKKINKLGLPFWLAGGFADPEKLAAARASGASGIQIGTAFAFCDESGIAPDYKRRVIEMSLAGQASVFTDPNASPTGFPFKVVQLDGTISQADEYDRRPRICDMGYLRRAYQRDDGKIGYRCPAEPIDQYIAKGGKVEDTAGRKCICNALFATIGYGQLQADGFAESPILTAGDDVSHLARYIEPGRDSYTAAEVLDYLLGASAVPASDGVATTTDS